MLLAGQLAPDVGERVIFELVPRPLGLGIRCHDERASGGGLSQDLVRRWLGHREIYRFSKLPSGSASQRISSRGVQSRARDASRRMGPIRIGAAAYRPDGDPSPPPDKQT